MQIQAKPLPGAQRNRETKTETVVGKILFKLKRVGDGADKNDSKKGRSSLILLFHVCDFLCIQCINIAEMLSIVHFIPRENDTVATFS